MENSLPSNKYQYLHGGPLFGNLRRGSIFAGFAAQSAEGEQKAFEWVLKRMERQFKQLGIRLQHSETGSEFDGATMSVYGSEGEDVEEEEAIFETNVESLKDTVKESVCPAFMWTIPSLIGDAKEWCMESEKVCIYK